MPNSPGGDAHIVKLTAKESDTGASDSFHPVGHWKEMAGVWNQVAPPLRPSSEDQEIYLRHARTFFPTNGFPRILLLGVTPEIYRIAWPESRDFLAVDHALEMIKQVWPGRTNEVMHASWLDLPLPAESRDVAICDGGLMLLDYPVSQTKLVERLHGVLRKGGGCIFRLFALPAQLESPDDVISDLLAGLIPNTNILKLRLAMSLHQSREAGVPVHTIRQRVRDLAESWESLAERLGWPLPSLQSLDVYQNSTARHYFSHPQETIDLFCRDGRFAVRGLELPTYRLGERCPFLIFERL